MRGEAVDGGMGGVRNMDGQETRIITTKALRSKQNSQDRHSRYWIPIVMNKQKRLSNQIQS